MPLEQGRRCFCFRDIDLDRIPKARRSALPLERTERITGPRSSRPSLPPAWFGALALSEHYLSDVFWLLGGPHRSITTLA